MQHQMERSLTRTATGPGKTQVDRPSGSQSATEGDNDLANSRPDNRVVLILMKRRLGALTPDYRCLQDVVRDRRHQQHDFVCSGRHGDDV